MDNKIAVVAGGTGGIGEAICRRMCRDGYSVYIGYNKKEQRAKSLAAELQSKGGKSFPIQINVLNPEMVECVFKEIFEREKCIHALVNAIGINRESPALGMDDETWETVVNTNLTGAFRLCRAAAKYILLSGKGAIVMVSSISAHKGGRGQMNYAVSKAGLETLVRVLALETGKKGIRVNAVAPGVIETEMSQRIRAEFGRELIEAIALKRFGQREEIASAVSFLVSPESSYITGQVLSVDGGMGL